ncbi:hypothetical protein PR048_024746 [Dryococelus australis]|uniref:Uncharacterized protein n=1 Tax=Dryococelus australis TaxID=614101 RepID=A0ABQ9GPE1_9NEOP|nr:hypothetical protein PR048_024746 [Dryococelus australis]
MEVIEVSMERRRNERARGTGNPQENPPTSGIPSFSQPLVLVACAQVNGAFTHTPAEAVSPGDFPCKQDQHWNWVALVQLRHLSHRQPLYSGHVAYIPTLLKFSVHSRKCLRKFTRSVMKDGNELLAFRKRTVPMRREAFSPAKIKKLLFLRRPLLGGIELRVAHAMRGNLASAIEDLSAKPTSETMHEERKKKKWGDCSGRYTQRDGNTARQFSALRVGAKGRQARVSLSFLSVPRFSSSNALKTSKTPESKQKASERGGMKEEHECTRKENALAFPRSDLVLFVVDVESGGICRPYQETDPSAQRQSTCGRMAVEGGCAVSNLSSTSRRAALLLYTVHRWCTGIGDAVPRCQVVLATKIVPGTLLNPHTRSQNHIDGPCTNSSPSHEEWTPGPGNSEGEKGNSEGKGTFRGKKLDILREKGKFRHTNFQDGGHQKGMTEQEVSLYVIQDGGLALDPQFPVFARIVIEDPDICEDLPSLLREPRRPNIEPAAVWLQSCRIRINIQHVSAEACKIGTGNRDLTTGSFEIENVWSAKPAEGDVGRKHVEHRCMCPEWHGNGVGETLRHPFKYPTRVAYLITYSYNPGNQVHVCANGSLVYRQWNLASPFNLATRIRSIQTVAENHAEVHGGGYRHAADTFSDEQPRVRPPTVQAKHVTCGAVRTKKLPSGRYVNHKHPMRRLHVYAHISFPWLRRPHAPYIKILRVGGPLLHFSVKNAAVNLPGSSEHRENMLVNSQGRNTRHTTRSRLSRNDKAWKGMLIARRRLKHFQEKTTDGHIVRMNNRLTKRILNLAISMKVKSNWLIEIERDLQEIGMTGDILCTPSEYTAPWLRPRAARCISTQRSEVNNLTICSRRRNEITGRRRSRLLSYCRRISSGSSTPGGKPDRGSAVSGALFDVVWTTANNSCYAENKALFPFTARDRKRGRGGSFFPAGPPPRADRMQFRPAQASGVCAAPLRDRVPVTMFPDRLEGPRYVSPASLAAASCVHNSARPQLRSANTAPRPLDHSATPRACTTKAGVTIPRRDEI